MDSRLDAVLTADLSELQLGQIIYLPPAGLFAFQYACLYWRVAKACRDVTANVNVDELPGVCDVSRSGNIARMITRRDGHRVLVTVPVSFGCACVLVRSPGETERKGVLLRTKTHGGLLVRPSGTHC